MIDALVIEHPSAAQVALARQVVAAVYPDVPITPYIGPEAGDVTIAADRWRAGDFDPLTVDEAVATALQRRGRVRLRVREEASVPGPPRCCLGTVCRQVMTRYQRLLATRNRHSGCPLFDRALALHRDLHDLHRPLPAADYDHSRDTWRWVLRLERDAGLAVQLAALFHDVERLDSESEMRVEHRSPDYLAFKQRHAAQGAARVRALLVAIDAPAALAEDVAVLVEGHEQPAGDPDRQLLNEADALSFFSLNACGFARYYGPAHTRRKVEFTLGRLGPRGWAELGRIRHRADLQALIDACRPPEARL